MKLSSALPTIDVVILSLNRAGMTIAASNSALEQSGVDVTVWIVDQGSDANHLEQLRRHTGQNNTVNLTELEENIGVAAGRNLGMSLGTAEFIVSLDDDAEFEDRSMASKGITYFADDPSLAIVSMRIINYFSKKDDLPYWSFARQLIVRRDETFLVTRFLGGGHILRRKCLDDPIRYDDRLFFYWEELDLSYQLINHGYHILYAGDVRILHKNRSSELPWLKWAGKRYYYYVRNALYLDYKYRCSLLHMLSFAGGYAIKGFKNRVLGHALRGIVDGIRMALRTQCHGLNEAARTYIQDYDEAYRGSWIDRLRLEAFESGLIE